MHQLPSSKGYWNINQLKISDALDKKKSTYFKWLRRICLRRILIQCNMGTRHRASSRVAFRSWPVRKSLCWYRLSSWSLELDKLRLLVRELIHKEQNTSSCVLLRCQAQRGCSRLAAWRSDSRRLAIVLGARWWFRRYGTHGLITTISRECYVCKLRRRETTEVW